MKNTPDSYEQHREIRQRLEVKIKQQREAHAPSFVIRSLEIALEALPAPPAPKPAKSIVLEAETRLESREPRRRDNLLPEPSVPLTASARALRDDMLLGGPIGRFFCENESLASYLAAELRWYRQLYSLTA